MRTGGVEPSLSVFARAVHAFEEVHDAGHVRIENPAFRASVLSPLSRRNRNCAVLADALGVWSASASAAGFNNAVHLFFGDGDSRLRIFHLDHGRMRRPFRLEKLVLPDSRIAGSLLSGRLPGRPEP